MNSSRSHIGDLVHGTLARLAQTCPDRIAISEGPARLTFAQLHTAVLQRAEALVADKKPTIVFVGLADSITHNLVDFLATVHSGRCAAVADPAWPVDLRQRLQDMLAGPPAAQLHASPESDFYIGFTSGSTGMPKGFMRSHRSWVESFRVCQQTFGMAASGRILAPGGMSHSLFLFGMLLGLWTGGGVVVQSSFSAAKALATLAEGQTLSLVAVPSQLVMMLQHARRRNLGAIEGVQLVMISGARWMRQRTPELRALFPKARIVEFYGASETSFVAWTEADEHLPDMVVGQPFGGVELEIRHRAPGEQAGLIFVRSAMLFNRYVGDNHDATAALQEEGGWLSVRDMGYLDGAGRLVLVGRQQRMIVTAGKNLFAEEVEACLSRCPGVAAASVHGLPDPLRGRQVVAWVRPEAGVLDEALSPAVLSAWCREHLEAYKVPRRFQLCGHWPLTAGGKTDHPALAARGFDGAEEGP
jgi:long-chain acyl-CoA synthetase